MPSLPSASTTTRHSGLRIPAPCRRLSQRADSDDDEEEEEGQEEQAAGEGEAGGGAAPAGKLKFAEVRLALFVWCHHRTHEPPKLGCQSVRLPPGLARPLPLPRNSGQISTV